MSEHTAGPWRYWTQKRTGCEDTCTFQNLKGEEVLRAVTVTLTEADACLIEAAPDLLAACKRFLVEVQWESARADIVTDEARADIALAKAAIAKATRANS